MTKAYGVEWPLYRESKEYQEAKKAKARLALQNAPSSTRSELVSFDKVYAPIKTPLGRMPLYVIYDAAIIDAILELYPASYNLYSQIVIQWNNPDCQMVFGRIKAEPFNIQAPNSTGWKQQESLMRDYVKRYCNRPRVLKMGRVKIQLETSPFLSVALLLRTIGEHLKLSFDDLNAYRGEAKGIKERRKHSRQWDKFVKEFKRAGYGLIYGDDIRETAHLWVRVRILNTMTIAQFAKKELDISKRKLLDRLAPFDKAMGYDRHPG